jgi:hypothetical protein
MLSQNVSSVNYKYFRISFYIYVYNTQEAKINKIDKTILYRKLQRKKYIIIQQYVDLTTFF